MLHGLFRCKFVRLIVVFLETPGLSRVVEVASWGRMSEGEDVGGTLWGRMSEGGNPREGRSEYFEKELLAERSL